MAEWISVKERLPPEFDYVIVYAPTSRNIEGAMTVAWWDRSGDWYSSVLTEFGTPTRISCVEAWRHSPDPPAA